MSEQQIPDRILDMLRKLMSLKEGAEKVGSLAEAENAALRISEILLKYNLEMSSINFEKGNDVENEEVRFEWMKWDGANHHNSRKNEGKWYTQLYTVVAEHNLCRALLMGGRNKVIWGVQIIGKRVNIEVTKYMIRYLERHILNLSKIAWIGYDDKNQNKNTFIRSFLIGAVLGLRYKFSLQRNEQSQHANINALIKNEMGSVDLYINEKEKNVRTQASKLTVGDVDAQHLGFKAGRDIKINKGIEATNSFNQKMIG